jgi:hypothetical protein
VLHRAAGERGEGPFYFEVDGHLNANGHRFVATVLRDYLVERALVPQ